MSFSQIEIQALHGLLALLATAATGLVAKGVQWASNHTKNIKNSALRNALDAALTETGTLVEKEVAAAYTAADTSLNADGTLTITSLNTIANNVQKALSATATAALKAEYTTLLPLLTTFIQGAASAFASQHAQPTPVAAVDPAPSA